jgi:hypothetical protein
MGGGLLIRHIHALGIEAPDRSLAARRQHASVAEDDVPASACTSVSLASTLSREPDNLNTYNGGPRSTTDRQPDNLNTYTHTHNHTYIHTDIHTYIHTYIQTYIQSINP